ncbi:MAG TPA: hypothetical protein VGI33_11405 [Paenibacillus sp.]
MVAEIEAYADRSGGDGIVLKKRSVRLCHRISSAISGIQSRNLRSTAIDRKDNPSA